MKILVAALAVGLGIMGAVSEADAQAAGPQGPAGPAFEQPAAPQKAPRKRKASATDIARMQRRMAMNPDEAKRDQQIEVLEARAGGSTSMGRGTSRQYESGNGGFTVRRFRDKTGSATQKRGQTRPAPGINPKGKPLKHKKTKRFLFFKV
ncbi:hypothetical protein LRS06_12180 [Hymenobacter sp. J193]|uniref:hypothetical protein n=1 Tax=Hymenobacter sp. J193 TaxID=2898429 RepID=UPI002150782D|nr:hypothetical protein [Hymenobacter sp. J193]MCR5888510.1 hypothetical protein [Hymenobacter sp. J193]